MSIGASIAVIAIGAILAFATHLHASGFSVIAVGTVLMIVGGIALFMQIAALHRQRALTTSRATRFARTVVVRPPRAWPPRQR